MRDREESEESDGERDREKRAGTKRGRGICFSENAWHIDGSTNCLQTGLKVTVQETLLKVSRQAVQDLSSP